MASPQTAMSLLDGIQVSDGVTYLVKMLPDSSSEWYKNIHGTWVLERTEPIPASVDHKHSELDVKVEIKKVGTLVFESGVLTNFVPEKGLDELEVSP